MMTFWGLLLVTIAVSMVWFAIDRATIQMKRANDLKEAELKAAGVEIPDTEATAVATKAEA